MSASRLTRVNAHLETVATGGYLLDRYTAVTSGGSSGERGVFVYDWHGLGDVLAERASAISLRERTSDPADSERPADGRLGSWRVTSAMPRPRSAARSPART